MAFSAVCGHCENMITTAHITSGRIVNCSLCYVPFHSYCLKITHSILKGLNSQLVHVICDPCLEEHSSHCRKKAKLSSTSNQTLVSTNTSPSPPDQSRPNLDEETDRPIPVPVKETEAKQGPGNMKTSEMTSNIPEAKPKKERCTHYLKGACRYGRYCIKDHSQICWNLYRTGSCLEECKYKAFHKEVCSGSQESKSCLNLECGKIHLKGTRRLPDIPSTHKLPSYTNTYHTPLHGNVNSSPKSKAVSPDVAPKLSQYVQPKSEIQNLSQKLKPLAPSKTLPSNENQWTNSLASLQTKSQQQQLRLQTTETHVQQLLQSYGVHNSQTIEAFNSINNNLLEISKQQQHTNETVSAATIMLSQTQERLKKSEENLAQLNAQMYNVNVWFQSHIPHLVNSNPTLSVPTSQAGPLNQNVNFGQGNLSFVNL